ncbi:MAG: energy transducer TonB [Gemmatimonadetes bacterium]|nr:energy transducer TonB [Gemmatimonadota bacterium]MDE2677321.1 energy transducer TonB [Gemmatimonadota bacterium]MYA10654.1 energy transducer TonB [Gemmatimonadota bacterium]MYD14434.1 energy transducer TonB [Gemmatimonadota bacterium]MYE70447.1 energy transducer TonB [Gemmatimonadota bacterium]
MTPLPGRQGGSRPEPAEMEALDKALREIAIDERCSFGAELRSELVKEYDRLRSGASRPPSTPGLLQWGWAAAIVVVAGGFLSFSQARSALMWPFRTDAAEVPESGEPAPSRRDGSHPETIGTAGLAAPAGPAPESVEVDSVSASLPVLADRDAARRIVANEYPPLLQERGVGGTVGILAWVTPAGAPELLQIDSSSGLAELDRAAVRAAQALRFQPATRLGVAVGTWVILPIRFLPNATEVLVEPESEALRIPLSN